MDKLLISPHDDDQTLFCSFTIQREHPIVCIVFDSYIQPARGNTECIWTARRQESVFAHAELGEYPVTARTLHSLHVRDDDPEPEGQILERLRKWVCDLWPTGCTAGYSYPMAEVYYPAFEKGGHEQHNATASAVEELFEGSSVKLTPYLTYTRTHGKSRSGKEVPYTPEMISRKLRAMSHYRSQMGPNTGTAEWFVETDLREYYL